MQLCDRLRRTQDELEGMTLDAFNEWIAYAELLEERMKDDGR